MQTKQQESLAARIRRWLVWKWWELLIIVLILLVAYWITVGITYKYVSMTTSVDGVTVSQRTPKPLLQDYWSSGGYLGGAATLLPKVTADGDAEVNLDFGLFFPHFVKVQACEVYDMNNTLAEEGVTSEFRKLDRDYLFGDLSFPVAKSEHPQVVEITARWITFGGIFKITYVFLLSPA